MQNENKAFRGKMFVNGIDYIKDWNELVEISKTKKKESPVKYVIRDNSLKYAIFTEEYSEDGS